ncbi:hypothetical protein OQY15_01205 [Pedobacter sp. MC2016-15]|uniref:hypothetical protein n=1 Tax=Pedobacter sp. MC2016-15 TaxID=2994473 RepID=UPI002246AAF3|nr:hypothetical protein [Pedobacter sp. MC2016-15]MCX2477685.1 hypothetical protein [Pedobacter sp. MC2016-15]
MSKVLFPLLFYCILFFTNTVKGQAKNALGIGPALNSSKRGSYNNPTGFGGRLQGEIKLLNKISVIPAIGLEGPYSGYFGISGKYYPADRFHLMAGGIAYIGRDLYTGVGPSLAVGYQLLASKRHFIDIDLHGDIIKVDAKGHTTIIGLRLTYNFSFSRQNKD